MLELFGIPYVGHDPMMAGILDNKHVFKRQLRAAGIPTAEFHIWQPGIGEDDPTAEVGFKAAFGDFAGPFVVKPVSGRASLNVTLSKPGRAFAAPSATSTRDAQPRADRALSSAAANTACAVAGR